MKCFICDPESSTQNLWKVHDGFFTDKDGVVRINPFMALLEEDYCDDHRRMIAQKGEEILRASNKLMGVEG